jgi:Arc/MetJ family transcription regulator
MMHISQTGRSTHGLRNHAIVRSMRKHTTLDLDQDLVRDAAAALGTSRTTDTVHAALADVVARRRRAVLALLELPDLTPDTLASVRAPRRFDVPADERAAAPATLARSGKPDPRVTQAR